MLESLSAQLQPASRRPGISGWFLIVTLAATCLAVPAFHNDYYNSFLFFLFIAIVMASTYDTVAGYTGYINLGHGAYFGMGAYAYGIAIEKTGSNILSVPAAILASVLLAGLMSIPLFRLRGAYFSIATFGVLKVLSVLADNLHGLTGGPTGLSIMPTDSTLITYYLAFIACIGAILLNRWIAHSTFGLALMTIREDEGVAESSGVPTLSYKRVALAVSAALPGFVGAIYMWQMTYIDPDSAFGANVAFTPVIMAMLGGSGTVVGPLIGAVFLSFVQEVLWSHIGYLQLTMYGVVLVTIGLLMPGGLMRNRWFARAYLALGFKDHYGYGPSHMPGNTTRKMEERNA